MKNPFPRPSSYKLFKPTTDATHDVKDLARKLRSNEVVCCCTLRWCGKCENVILVALPHGGIKYLKRKSMIAVSKSGLKKDDYNVSDGTLNLALHHFHSSFVEVSDPYAWHPKEK